MYQFIVLCLGFLLLFGGGYLIKKTDKNSIVTDSFSSTGPKSMDANYSTLPTSEDMDGTFLCDSGSGCTDDVSINLVKTGDVSMTTNYKDGTATLTEKGRWTFEQGGFMSIKLSEANDVQYDIPHILLVQSVGTSTLSKISYDKNFYKGMNRPVFSRPNIGQ